MDSSIYNTKQGIATMIGTLDDFNKLIAARGEAFRKGEKLEEFVVFGRFILGYSFPPLAKTRGDWLSEEGYKQIPSVTTYREFQDHQLVYPALVLN